MKKFLALFSLFFLCAQHVLGQCAMCKVTAEQSVGEELEFGHNINYGIILLMVVPYILIFILFRKQIIALFNEIRGRKNKKKAE